MSGCFSPDNLPEGDICNKIMGSKTSCRTPVPMKKKTSQKSLDRKLLELFKAGDLDRVKDLLSAGAAIHAQDDRALCWASFNGLAEVVQMLLDGGADIHTQNDYALRWAAENGHIDVVRVLLDRGADVRAQDNYALLCSAGNGHYEVVGLLLDRGADIHAENDCALCWAAEKGHAEVVMLLIVGGADLEAGIQAAALCGNAEMAGLLAGVKLSRQEKGMLSLEVPVPGQADRRARM